MHIRQSSNNCFYVIPLYKISKHTLKTECVQNTKYKNRSFTCLFRIYLAPTLDLSRFYWTDNDLVPPTSSWQPVLALVIIYPPNRGLHQIQSNMFGHLHGNPVTWGAAVCLQMVCPHLPPFNTSVYVHVIDGFQTSFLHIHCVRGHYFHKYELSDSNFELCPPLQFIFCIHFDWKTQLFPGLEQIGVRINTLNKDFSIVQSVQMHKTVTQ